jgi:hypothetical protein
MGFVAILTVGSLAFASWAYALQGPKHRGDLIASGVLAWYWISLWSVQSAPGIRWCALSAAVAAIAAAMKGVVGEAGDTGTGEGYVKLGGEEATPLLV